MAWAQPARIPDSALLLQVKVSDSAGRPIANADVELDGTLLGLTDDSGAYLMPRREIPHKTYTLAVGLQGYETSRRSITIPDDASQWPVKVEVKLAAYTPRPVGSVGQQAPNYRVMRLFYATNRRRAGGQDALKFYANQKAPDNKLDLGQVDVSFPASHQPGAIELPNWVRMEFQVDPNRHVVMYKPQPMEGAAFYKQMADRTAASKNKEAFVFVHGYNVTFAEGARRAAQLAYDLGFDGPAVLYSWPSAATYIGYFEDEGRVAESAPVFAQFLEEVANRSGAERIHLIAHSIGNRAMGEAVRNIAQRHSKSGGPMFRQIVMAAPDVKLTVMQALQRAMVQRARRVTMYASAHDDALVMARIITGIARAGERIVREALVMGIEAVDASNVRADLLGHGYFAESMTVLTDLRRVLGEEAAAAGKNLRRAQLAGFPYWVIASDQ